MINKFVHSSIALSAIRLGLSIGISDMTIWSTCVEYISHDWIIDTHIMFQGYVDSKILNVWWLEGINFLLRIQAH